MTPKKKYQFIIAGTLLFFFYLLAAEIADRWQQTWMSYHEWQSKSEATPDADALRQQKTVLEGRGMVLKEQLNQKNADKIDQFTFLKSLHTTAKAFGVHIQALSPSQIQSKDTVASMSLKVETLAHYHDLGRFVNALETGGIPLAITKFEMTTQQSSNSMLDAFLEGKVLLPVEKPR